MSHKTKNLITKTTANSICKRRELNPDATDLQSVTDKKIKPKNPQKADFFHSKISKIFPYFYKSKFLKMYNFDEYLIQGEPNKAEKAKVWKSAIGFQQVDS